MVATSWPSFCAEAESVPLGESCHSSLPVSVPVCNCRTSSSHSDPSQLSALSCRAAIAVAIAGRPGGPSAFQMHVLIVVSTRDPANALSGKPPKARPPPKNGGAVLLSVAQDDLRLNRIVLGKLLRSVGVPLLAAGQPAAGPSSGRRRTGQHTRISSSPPQLAHVHPKPPTPLRCAAVQESLAAGASLPCPNSLSARLVLPCHVQLDLHVIEACDGRAGLEAYLQHGRDVGMVFMVSGMQGLQPTWCARPTAAAPPSCRCCGAGRRPRRKLALCRTPRAPPPRPPQDIMMPVCNGIQAVLSIRSAESRQGWLPVPIVAFTSEDVAHGSPLWHECMQSGFNDVVVSSALGLPPGVSRSCRC